MDWNYVVGDFCESKLYGHPEILNSLSCFFISFFPYIGLKYSEINSYLIKSIMTLLFFNGFASFGFHWTGYYIFKHLDEIPMVLCIWLGLLYTFSKIRLKLVYLFAFNCYIALLLAMNSIPSLGHLFPVTFGLTCIMLIPVQKALFDTADLPEKSKTLMISGSLISIASALIWIYTENFCSSLLLFGHPLWHFGMPLGMYYLMIAFEYYSISQSECYDIIYMYNILPIIKSIT